MSGFIFPDTFAAVLAMEVVSIILIAISLSFDSFAVSVCSGLSNRKILFFSAAKIAISLAVFQALMPVIGWFIGSKTKYLVEDYDHWIAFILLAVLGIKMIIDGFKPAENKTGFNPLKLAVLLSISVATSIDALVVGISFGFAEMRIWMAAFIIGLVTFFSSMTGILFGKKAAGKIGQKANVFGGLVLIFIGVKILIEHTLF